MIKLAKKSVVAASLAVIFCSNAQADTVLGLYLGAHVWANEAQGSFGEGKLTQASFNFNDEKQGSFYIAIEHPIPLIPNIKIASTTLDTIGGATLNSSFTFEGETYVVDSQVSTTFNTSYIDYTFYYELFDNDLLTFDVGITARDLDSDIAVTDTTTQASSSLSVSGVIPLLYANVIIGLPFTGFNLFAEGNYLSYDDQTISDYQVGISYELVDNLAVDVNLTLGYRSLELDLNDLDNLYSNLTFDGIFAGAVVHF